MAGSKPFPDIQRFSILTAIILLGYALAPFVNIPPLELSTTIFGILFNFQLNFKTYVSILTPALAAVGTIWLLSAQQPKRNNRSLLHHAILPTLSTWVIGLPLNRLALSLQWWVVFSLGGSLLVVVILSEFIVADSDNLRYTIAARALKALSFSLFLFLTIALRAEGMRLYLTIPALFLTAFFLLLRTFYLQLVDKWVIHWSLGIAFITSQIAIGLHYLPLGPIAYGFFLLAPTYAITEIAISIEEGRQQKRIWIEPGIMFLIFFVLAFLL